MRKLLFLFISFSFSVAVCATDIELNTRNLPVEMVQEAKRKATKVLDELSLKNSPLHDNVFIVVANRYLELREIHQAYGERNKAIEALKLDKKEMDERLEVSYYQCNSDLYRSRFGYITWLSFYLDDAQIEQVKDAMTLHLLPAQYDAFMKGLPELTEDQKKRVRSWFEEAREFSMDFETGRQMRQMFTKYRGRLNNYLSKCGYDISRVSKK